MSFCLAFVLFCLACCSPVCVRLLCICVYWVCVLCLLCVLVYCSCVSVFSVVSVGCSVCVLCLFYCVSACCPFLSMCSLYVCLICVACIYCWSVCLCLFLAYCVCVSIVSVFPCMCITCVLRVCVPVPVSYVYVSVVSLCVPCICLFPCMYVYVSTVFYVYCICYVYVCFSVLCLCCWLPCWCGVYHGGVMGACFLGLVVLVFWGVWRVWNFFIFYSRFGVGGRLLLGFCYRTFFCGFLWGLCHARNFFKDITHSYYGYVAPVIGLYMCLLAYLYRTPHCADIAPVYTCARVCLCLCSYLLASMSPLCFILCCPGIVPTLHLVLCLLFLVVCRVLHSVLGVDV